MAIVMKYGAPGPVLQAAYAAGVGSRANKEKDDALKLWQQQNQQQFQAQQSWLDRAQRAGMQQQAFAQQSQQAQLGREFAAEQQQNAFGFQSTQAGMAREFQADQTDKMLDFRKGESALDATRRLEEQRQREQFLREQNTEIGLRRGEMSLPPAARAQLDKLEADSVEAMKLDPEKKAEFMGKYTERKRELYGMAKPTNQVPYDDRVKESLGANYEQYKHLPWQFNSQGEMSLPGGFKMPGEDKGEQDQLFNKGAMTRYEKNLKEVDDENNPLYGDENKALQAAIDEQNKVERGRQRLMARGNAPANTSSGTSPDSGVVRADQNYAPDGRTYSTTPSGTPVYHDPNAGAISSEPDRPGASNEKVVPLGQTAGQGSSQPSAAETYTDPKSGGVYEKRGNAWVRIK